MPFVFQSTPGIAAGRIAGACVLTCSPAAFQSTPGIAAGRIAKHLHVRLVQIVSIHARHCCRANHHIILAHALYDLFQSTPGIAAGRIAIIF